jgi:hypothetical protein
LTNMSLDQGALLSASVVVRIEGKTDRCHKHMRSAKERRGCGGSARV